MKHFLFDIETCPLPEDQIKKVMPRDLVDPIMPFELAKPTEPDHTEGCPKYATKEHPDGDPTKRAEWVEKKRQAWVDRTTRQREAWEDDVMQRQQKFFDQAALSAVTGQVKLMNLWDTSAPGMSIIIAGATPAQVKQIDQFGRFPVPVSIVHVADERELVKQFDVFCREFIRQPVLGGKTFDQMTPQPGHEGGRLIGYNLTQFDLIFMFHKAWILGERVPRFLRDRNPRYWNPALVCDIRDAWKLGDARISTGGLSGLMKILGMPEKQGSGEGFWRLWRDDPFAAVLYNVNEMLGFRKVAERLGEV